MSRLRRMPLPAVADIAVVWTDQLHRKTASKLAAHVDREFYLNANPDVRSAGVDPAFHYAKYGWREGRDPSPSFSTQMYLAQHPELLTAETNPLLHFLETAVSSDAPPKEDEAQIDVVAAEMDAAFYRRKYGVSADIDAAQHYCNQGWRLGYDPSPRFSTRDYLSCNPDVQANDINPFWHYIVTGRTEGRAPKRLDGWKYDRLAEQRPLSRVREDWVRRDAPPELTRWKALSDQLKKQCRASHVLISIGHDDYRTSAGGIQLCMALEAKRAAQDKADYLCIVPWQSLPTLSATDADPIVTLLLNSEVLAHARMSDLVKAAGRVKLRNPNLIVHHLMGHDPDKILEMARALGMRTCLLWLHDNFTLCPNYTLQRNDIDFCGAPSMGSTACMICVYGAERQAHALRVARFFEGLEVQLVAPSKVALDFWQARTDLAPASTRVHPHMLLRHRKRPKSPPAQQSATCRIAFVGLPASHKGWPVFQSIFAELSQDPRYSFWHFASKDSAPEFNFVPISCSEDDPTASISALCANEIDIVIHWATCRETFSFSTYEAIAAGAQVVTNDGSGNVAATVRRYKAGHVFSNEAALFEWVRKDGLLDLAQTARARRSTHSVSTSYSAISLDVLELKERNS